MSELLSEEIIQEMMRENQKLSSRYVSCIRIDGSPILPPLIDERYRNELTHYRNLAILVEKKIKDRKKLKDNRHSVDSGVMINASSGEPSWLRPCILQMNQKELCASHSFDSREKSSCETFCLHRSNSSDDTSSKHFIYDDDLWRYVSNCADEQISTAWFDNQADEIISNFGAGLNANLNQSILTSRSCSHITNESETTRTNSTSDKSERFIDKGNSTVTRQNVFFEEYHKDIDISGASRNVDSNSLYEKNNINEIFKSFESQKVNEKSESNHVSVPPLNSESDFMSEVVHEQTLRNYCNDAMLYENRLNGEFETSGGEHHCDNRQTISNNFTSNFDCFKNNSNTIYPRGNAGSETEHCTNSGNLNSSSFFDTTLCESNIVNKETLSVKCGNVPDEKPLKNAQENKSMSMKISCSSVSLPEFPGSPSGNVHHKQKPEKPYNPMNYDECDGRKSTESSKQEIFRSNDTTADMQKNWSYNNMKNTSSDDSADEVCKNTEVTNSPYLENSLANENCSADTPMSESISVSEIGFLSSSIATVPPDTSEDANELHNHLSNEIDELTPPKLVRQNSYTLIAPSPILLAHAKATVKQDEKISSEDENAKSHLRKDPQTQIHDEIKTCKNSKQGVKYVYAVPCKQSSIVVQNKMKTKGRRKDKSPQREKVMSLPGSTASSPVKVKLFHSSLDNLPIVTVRRFQELIDRKSNQKPLHESKTNIDGQRELSEKRTLTNRSSSFDLQILSQTPAGDGLKCRSKSDLNESKVRPVTYLKPTDQETNQLNNDVEVLFREISFNSSPSDLSHPDMNVMSSPISNQINFYESPPNYNELKGISQNQDKVQENEQILVNNSLSSSGDAVQQIFLQLQNQHSQLMAQLLDRQKKEQEALANTFLNQQRQILLEMKLLPSSPMQISCANSDNGLGTEKYSPSTQQDNQTFASVSVASHLSSSVEMPRSSGNSDDSRHNNNEDKYNIAHPHSKELEVMLPSLLPQKVKSPVTEEQTNAATIINAAARGYLVRRLLKTEYVQEIINTISESVQCALQLQRECPVDITPSDIELHRRLIQQLTAACYSLHDTFFSLSIQEKINIIANDREKRRNPSSRPVSARSSLSTATQKYIQRKQQQNRHSERPAPNPRRSWWRSKARACSAGQYDQSSSSYSKQSIVVSSKQQCNNRAARRPWR